MKQPKTLQQAITYFANPENCLKFMVERRWPKGVACPTCGSKDVRFISTRRMWECKAKHARKQFSVKIGTIFEDSPISLDKWLTAVWMIANCKNGVSSYEVARAIGVTQKSAWFMMHRVRLAMQADSPVKLGGPGKEIEADETFIGGAARFMHAGRRRRMITGRGMRGKTTAFGILERGGHVRTFAVPNRRKKMLQGEIAKHVEEGTPVYTDALMSYMGLKEQFKHEVIDHAHSYVRGRVHTNGLENFWSLLKRGIRGTYVSVEPFHLFRYLDEQAFRFNMRKDPDGPVTDGERFDYVASHVLGKRLTYAELTGKTSTTDSHSLTA
jgi:transposase-like protein